MGTCAARLVPKNKKKKTKNVGEEPNQIGSELPVFPRARRRRLNELQLHNGAGAPRCH